MAPRRHKACRSVVSITAVSIAFAATVIAGSGAAKAVPTIIDFNAGQGFAVRSIPAGDPAGTGTTAFSRLGAAFAGGEVLFTGMPAFYASPPSSYVFDGSPGSVMFRDPATGVRFFFVDNAGGVAFTATAFDDMDNIIGTVSSNPLTVVNDPANFVGFDPDAAIRRIAFTGGIVDNFAFDVPEPGTLSILATGMLSLLALRRRRQVGARTAG